MDKLREELIQYTNQDLILDEKIRNSQQSIKKLTEGIYLLTIYLLLKYVYVSLYLDNV